MKKENDKEQQNIEWKAEWKEEYLKWICGFANAQGGKIYIGKNDNGETVGVKNAKKLLTDIPNKVRDVLGIIVDVNLHTSHTKEYLEIMVAPSSYPVNYKGEYHYRSGSTKQLLKGAALTQFLFERTGLTWDSVPMEKLDIKDFWHDSFAIFRRQALLSNRMDEQDLQITDGQLLDRLGLIKDGHILRAGMMLFYQEPEKWINGAYIKVGYFKSNTDIAYMDEIHGSLISQAEKVIDLLFTKYLTAHITYEGVTRIETYPFPKAAIREAVYNAIVHKNYATQIPIQISVYSDKLYISNDCLLPAGWTVDTLMSKHRSKPFNPNIANGFFRAGLIETWGRGIEKICEACIEHGTPIPEYTVHPEDIMVMFKCNEPEDADIVKKQPQSVYNKRYEYYWNTDMNTDMNTTHETSSDEYAIQKVLEFLIKNPQSTQKEIGTRLHITTRTVERAIAALKEQRYIERVGNNRSGYWEIKKHNWRTR